MECIDNEFKMRNLLVYFLVLIAINATNENICERRPKESQNGRKEGMDLILDLATSHMR